MNVYNVAQTTTTILFISTVKTPMNLKYYLLLLYYICMCMCVYISLNLKIFNGQEENMELKRQKTQFGEPLKWSDYLSLPFTQNVRHTSTLITGQYTKYLL